MICTMCSEDLYSNKYEENYCVNSVCDMYNTIQEGLTMEVSI
jgi:hypothetical protein